MLIETEVPCLLLHVLYGVSVSCERILFFVLLLAILLFRTFLFLFGYWGVESRDAVAKATKGVTKKISVLRIPYGYGVAGTARGTAPQWDGRSNGTERPRSTICVDSRGCRDADGA